MADLGPGNFPGALELLQGDVRLAVAVIVLVLPGIGLVLEKAVDLVWGGRVFPVFVIQVCDGIPDGIAGEIMPVGVLYDGAACSSFTSRLSTTL